MSPYEAFFGMKPKMGLKDFNLNNHIIANIHSEEDLENILQMDQSNIIDIENLEFIVNQQTEPSVNQNVLSSPPGIVHLPASLPLCQPARQPASLSTSTSALCRSR